MDLIHIILNIWYILIILLVLYLTITFIMIKLKSRASKKAKVEVTPPIKPKTVIKERPPRFVIINDLYGKNRKTDSKEH